MTNRKIFDQLKAHLTKKEYTILTGSRQTGKSTLLRQLERHCQQQHMPVAFINLVRPFYRNLRKELVKMPKVYFNDNGLRNSLINNFQQPNIRIDRGDLWENTVYRELANRYGSDEIHYWRTTSGNEVDFVLPNQEQPLAIEAKFDQSQIRQNKYKVFRETYPDIPLSFSCLEPFDTDLFRKLL